MIELSQSCSQCSHQCASAPVGIILKRLNYRVDSQEIPRKAVIRGVSLEDALRRNHEQCGQFVIAQVVCVYVARLQFFY